MGYLNLGNKKYTKADRLRKTCDYSLLSKYGSKYFNHYFIIILKNNGTFKSRLGVTVSKKVGNAVKRNNIKRVVREYFRLYIKNNLISYDINVIARKRLGKVNFTKIACNLNETFDCIIDKKVISKRDKTSQ